MGAPMDLSNMSDDDFLRAPAPVEGQAAEKTPEELEAERLAQEQAATEAAAALQAQKDAEEAEAARLAQEAAATAANGNAAPAVDPTKQQDPNVENKTEKTSEELAAEAAAKAELDKSNPTDYKNLYEKIMAPFKANGKTMQVTTPEEAIALMQMGANYTRKMQELQPQRKTLLMLENNGLMDPDKLSFLIDLHKGNPEAIKKLLKDSKFDAINTDLESESTYQGGNHKVSDEEANFRAVMDELNSNPVGKETLHVINSSWDQASKEVLWTNPEVMTTINAQRESGVYARIVAEVDRRRTFGQIQPGVPFLHAYKEVGDQLQAAGAFNDLFKQEQKKEPTTPAADTAAAVLLATKAAIPQKPAVDPRVAAAAVQRPAAAKPDVTDYSKLSDEDFLKLPIPK